MNKRVLFSSIVLISSSPALAGVVYEIETKDHTSPAANTEVISMSAGNGNLKMEINSGAQGSTGDMIFRGDRREMVVVDHDRKSYMVFDEETLRSIGHQVSDAEAQIQQALKDVPADQRAMIEAMMKRKMPQQATAQQRPSIEFRNTGEHDTKNGYEATKYEMWIDGRKVQDLWIASWEDIEGGDEAADAFRSMADLMSEMRDSLPSFAQNGDSDGKMFEHMREINGFPVLTYDYAADGSLEGESSLRSAKRQSFDPGAFDPPATYTRQTTRGR